MEIYFDTLQYVIACLLTHAHWINKFKKNLHLLTVYFNLTERDYLALCVFLKVHGQSLLISGLLSEKKRWRQLLPTLQYTHKLITTEDLQLYWAQYLNSFELKNSIPKSQKHESIQFLTFVLKHLKSDSIIREVILFEISRNHALAYEFTTVDKKNNFNIDSPRRNLSLYHAIPNPSLTIEIFKFPISQLIQNLKSEKTLISEVNYIKKKEIVLFYKDIISEKVKCIQLNEKAFQYLTHLLQAESLLSWLAYMNDNANNQHKNSIQLLEKLSYLGIIAIVKIKKECYVH